MAQGARGRGRAQGCIRLESYFVAALLGSGDSTSHMPGRRTGARGEPVIICLSDLPLPAPGCRWFLDLRVWPSHGPTGPLSGTLTNLNLAILSGSPGPHETRKEAQPSYCVSL